MRINMNYEEKAGIMNEGEMVNDENVIVIRKSWWGVIFGYMRDTVIVGIILISLAFIFNILILQNFFDFNIDMKIVSITIISVLFTCILIERIVNILTAKIEVNLRSREAFSSGITGKSIIHEVIEIDLYKNPIFPVYNSVVIRGKGFKTSFGLAFIKDYKKVEKFVDKFYTSKQKV